MIALMKMCLSIATIIGLFSLWGYFSSTGQKYFDEMDGLIPFFGLILSLAMFLIFGLILAFLNLRKK